MTDDPSNATPEPTPLPIDERCPYCHGIGYRMTPVNADGRDDVQSRCVWCCGRGFLKLETP